MSPTVQASPLFVDWSHLRCDWAHQCIYSADATTVFLDLWGHGPTAAPAERGKLL